MSTNSTTVTPKCPSGPVTRSGVALSVATGFTAILAGHVGIEPTSLDLESSTLTIVLMTYCLAGAVGFEPTWDFRRAGFGDQCLRPLDNTPVETVQLKLT